MLEILILRKKELFFNNEEKIKIKKSITTLYTKYEIKRFKTYSKYFKILERSIDFGCSNIPKIVKPYLNPDTNERKKYIINYLMIKKIILSCNFRIEIIKFKPKVKVDSNKLFIMKDYECICPDCFGSRGWCDTCEFTGKIDWITYLKRGGK